MPVNVIGTLKPKNNGKFPVAEAVDIKVTDDLRLDEVLENKADLATVNFALAGKANVTALATSTANLQGQINQIVISSSAESVVAPEVAAARVSEDGTEYSTLKERIDAEITDINSTISDNSALIASKNLFNPDAATIVQNRLVTESISVIAGDKYYLSVNATSPVPMVAATFFGVYETINGVETLSDNHWIKPYVVPEGVTSVRLIIQQKNYEYIMIEKGSASLKWEAYFTPYYRFKDDIARTGVHNNADSILAMNQPIEVVLPRKIVGTVGTEINVYKDNALLYQSIDSVADCKFIDFIAGYFEDKYRFCGLPTVERNSYPQFSVYIYGIKNRQLFKNVNLKILDTSILNGLTRNILVIGDSKVAGCRLPEELRKKCVSAGMNVGDFLGTLSGNGWTIKHEGRAGWSSVDYMNASKNDVINPFYNQSTSSFDFDYYMTHQGYSAVDYVFINLGTNDYATVSGLGEDTYIQTFIDNINTMIESIHDYNSNVKIIVGLTEGVCTYQWSSASDEELRNLNTRARLLNKACIAEWDNNTAENNNVFICPIYLSMDMYNDYNAEDVALSQRDADFETGKTRRKVTDFMHQNAAGYGKNADYMFAMITYCESLNT